MQNAKIKTALLSFAAFTVVQVNLPSGPRSIVPMSLPGVGVPGVVRQPMQLPSLPTQSIPGGLYARAAIAPGLIDEKPSREGLNEILRKIADDPVARERMGEVFDNARRPRRPVPPVFGR